MLYTWIYIHLQAQRPLHRCTGRAHELPYGEVAKAGAHKFVCAHNAHIIRHNTHITANNSFIIHYVAIMYHIIAA